MHTKARHSPTQHSTTQHTGGQATGTFVRVGLSQSAPPAAVSLSLVATGTADQASVLPVEL